MQFGVRATDADGDSVNGVVTINVLDDGPVAVNDGAFVTSTAPVTGNVLGNDDPGSDGLGAVKAVTFNGTTTNIAPGATVVIVGTYGTLTISFERRVFFTAKGGADGTDTFRYTMNDYDGDTSSANLEICVTVDDNPIVIKPDTKIIDETNLGPISVGGTVSANFFNDVPARLRLMADLRRAVRTGRQPDLAWCSCCGYTNGANGYVGMAGTTKVFDITINPANGAYYFTQYDVLDHADGSNPNDVITLNFGVKATDADGDVANTSITINILDDAPIANDDGMQDVNGGATLTGNVLANDDTGNDVPGKVIIVNFNGVNTVVPQTGTVNIVGAYGVLTIDGTGAYSYKANLKRFWHGCVHLYASRL